MLYPQYIYIPAKPVTHVLDLQTAAEDMHGSHKSLTEQCFSSATVSVLNTVDSTVQHSFYIHAYCRALACYEKGRAHFLSRLLRVSLIILAGQQLDGLTWVPNFRKSLSRTTGRCTRGADFGCAAREVSLISAPSADGLLEVSAALPAAIAFLQGPVDVLQRCCSVQL